MPNFEIRLLGKKDQSRFTVLKYMRPKWDEILHFILCAFFLKKIEK